MTRALANVRVRGTVYHFRRRVPQTLAAIFGQVEIVRSLRTSSAKEARRRAAILLTETDQAFHILTNRSLAADQVANILRRLREESLWESPTADELIQEWRENDETPLQNFIDLAPEQIVNLPEEQRDHLLQHYDVLRRQMRVDDLIMERDIARAEAMTERRRADEAVARARQAEKAGYIATGMAVAGGMTGAGSVKGNPDSLDTPSALFSHYIEEFIEHKKQPDDEGKFYTEQTVAQTRKTFALWVELIGEKPVREYTRAEAGSFRRLLLKLPFSHGKDHKSATPRSALESIDRNETEKKPTLTLKTAKRHFSSLTQYWKWLKTRGHVDDVIFSGFEFPGTKSKKKKRDDWSPEDLGKVFNYQPWYGDAADRDSAYFWLPLIALHSGMRLEEIARLRPKHDVQVRQGVSCFEIQPHPDGWNPKTEAGERAIPIHPFLLDLGFLDFVEARVDQPYLFTDLSPSGRDGKRGAAFSREFSRVKSAIGVGAKTTFHSFRHSVRTLLTDVGADILRDAWIDAMMGHHADDGQSEGVTTYTKRIEIGRLREVVTQIKPPIDLRWLLKT